MSRGRKASPTLIGAFVLGAAALAVVAVAVFGSGRLFRQRVEVVSYFAGSVNGLKQGAPVKFRGVEIGEVTAIRFRLPETEAREVTSPEDIRIPVWGEIDVTRLAALRGRAPMLDRARLDQLIAMGLRAQLQTESFVTGVLFVGLDFFPDTPVDLVLPPDSGILEVPTLPTTLEQAFATISKVMTRIDHIDVEGLMEALRTAVDGVNAFVRSPEVEQAVVAARDALTSIRQLSQSAQPGVAPTLKDVQAAAVQARQSLEQIDRTLTQLQSLVDPRAPLAVGATRTLADLGAAARSIAALAQYLDSNPNAILTGRPGS